MPRRLDVVSATRLHFPDGTATIPEVTVRHLKAYANSTWRLGISSAVAVNCLESEVRRILLEAVPDLNVTVLHIPVWGAFVAALNALLGEAQRQGSKYILYQSLEVACAPPVLRLLLDHFTPDALVVGPVLDGHTFTPGEQPLNGRTTPWNTLALWSTRKLGLTGFLSIADGMPQTASIPFSRQITGGGGMSERRQFTDDSVEDEEATVATQGMGSAGWWESHIHQGGVSGGGLPARQTSDYRAVPAGVEEVTAIALLQHLLGATRARAILLQVPRDLRDCVEWTANWAGDERRKQWHEYKMASKVARPAAQIQRLFGGRLRSGVLSGRLGLQVPLLCAGGEDIEPRLNFGKVHHFGESIRPSAQVEGICLVCVALFFANFASAFAAAFRAYNDAVASGEGVSVWTIIYVCALVGGVYLPMPISLRLTRFVTARGDHFAGFTLFAGVLLVAHLAIILREVGGHGGGDQQAFVLGMRLLQGLGSGVLFQARFVLASLSTQDHHQNLQALMLFAGDLGFGLGALLPMAAASIVGDIGEKGGVELPSRRPELCTSCILALLSLILLVWIFVAFPDRLHRLPHKVRFRNSRVVLRSSLGSSASLGDMLPTPPPTGGGRGAGSKEPPDYGNSAGGGGGAAGFVLDGAPAFWAPRLIASGTMRAFVQSAAMMAMALRMSDAGLTGDFRQTSAVALLILVPAPFEALVSGACLGGAVPRNEEHVQVTAIAIVGADAALFAVTSFFGYLSSTPLEVVCLAGAELGVLLLALAVAAPQHASRLYGQRDAEAAMVALEWLKAYVGRLLAPLVAIAVRVWLGYNALLALLCVATVGVALTA